MRALVVALVALAGCDNGSFRDCAVSCTTDTGCPDGFTCGREGRCRLEGVAISCSDVLADASDSSCACTSEKTLTCAAGPIQCALGCLEVPNAGDRCFAVAPSNELSLAQLGDVSVDIAISGATTFDTDTGAITGAITRDAGAGVNNDIGFTTALAPIGVFTFHRLTVTLSGVVRLTGTRAAAFIVETTASIDGTLDGSAGCNGTDASCPGPGGGAGGNTAAAAGCGPGGDGMNAGVTAEDSGGGGGGGGRAGAAGGIGGTTETVPGAAGAQCTLPTAEPLAGGSGGGKGGPGSSATVSRGGGGGGGFQLTALEQITVGGAIAMGGAGGLGGGGGVGTGGAGAGGGGGAGGTILLEAPAITIQGTLAANGGGGGGAGNNDVAGMPGGAGAASAVPAVGGTPATTGGRGGNGGAGATAATAGAQASANGGGGGGGVGVVFLRSATAPQAGGAVLSPTPGTGPIRTR